MAGYILDGFLVAQKKMSLLAEEIAQYSFVRPPKITVVLVGDDIASSIYVQHKVKASARVGIHSNVVHLQANISQEMLKKKLTELNNDDSTDAILLQLPLPKHLNTEEALKSIDPYKDADCLHPFNIGLLVQSKAYITPCTPSGIFSLLKHYKISLESSHITVVGRSLIVGKPFGLLALQYNATVTICHSYTKDIKKFTSCADVIVVAIGKARFLTSNMVKEGSIVIDVGINREGKKLVGDTDFDALLPKVKAITPVPKGIGPMTIFQLLQNTVTIWKKRMSLE